MNLLGLFFFVVYYHVQLYYWKGVYRASLTWHLTLLCGTVSMHIMYIRNVTGYVQ
jgi:hypothetical protein